MASLAIIVAVAQNGVIGMDNTMPWHLPADLKRFKALTMGKPLLMGRKTFESLGRPLPGRPHVVISRDRTLSLPDGVHLANSFEDGLAVAFALAPADGEVMAIGGSAVFSAALPLGDRLYLTEIHQAYQGDTFFPTLDRRQWIEKEREEIEGNPAFAFVTLDKVRK